MFLWCPWGVEWKQSQKNYTRSLRFSFSDRFNRQTRGVDCNTSVHELWSNYVAVICKWKQHNVEHSLWREAMNVAAWSTVKLNLSVKTEEVWFGQNYSRIIILIQLEILQVLPLYYSFFLSEFLMLHQPLHKHPHDKIRLNLYLG